MNVYLDGNETPVCDKCHRRYVGKGDDLHAKAVKDGWRVKQGTIGSTAVMQHYCPDCKRAK